MSTSDTASLRVLHVLSELKPSGAETMLVNAAEAFRANGVELSVLSTGAVPGVYAERFATAGFRVLHLPFARSPAFFPRLVGLLRRERFDVVHLHVESANFWFGLAALLGGAKLVVRTVHNVFSFDGMLRRKRRFQRQALARLGLVHVAIGDSVAANETGRFGLDCRMVRNWYDSRRFVPPDGATRARLRAQFGIGPDQVALVVIGNCSHIKNHDLLIRALARLPESRRPLCLHAGIEAGDEPERVLAQELGVADAIRFLGRVDDVLPLLHAADAYVMPSLFEGFSISALEALGCGLPAVLTRVPGLRDLERDFPGLIYASLDEGEFAAALERLLDTLPEQRTMAAHYAGIAQTRFGLERGAREYVELYREEMARH